MIFLRILLGLLLLAVAAFSVMFVSLCTAFAGSTHNPPSGYGLYLAITQALPILSYSVACLIIIGYIVIAKPIPILVFKIFGASILVYCLSIVGMFFILS